MAQTMYAHMNKEKKFKKKRERSHLHGHQPPHVSESYLGLCHTNPATILLNSLSVSHRDFVYLSPRSYDSKSQHLNSGLPLVLPRTLGNNHPLPCLLPQIGNFELDSVGT
jgi:hypothetical protein